MAEDSSHEIWKPILGYEGEFEVSNLGNVRRLARITIAKNGKKFKYKQKNMPKHLANHGYWTVNLTKQGERQSRPFLVHRLVASAFLGYFENMDVHHINEVTSDNSLNNLEWVSRKENVNYGKNRSPIEHIENTINRLIVGYPIDDCYQNKKTIVSEIIANYLKDELIKSD